MSPRDASIDSALRTRNVDGHSIAYVRRGGRYRALFRLDLRPAQGARREVLPPKIRASASEKRVVTHQCRQGSRAHRDRTHATPGLAEARAAERDGRWATAY